MEASWPPGVVPLTEKELKDLLESAEKLEAVKTILYNFCDYYGTETCKEGVCDIDPNGWEGCLTRQILEILEDFNKEGEKVNAC